MTKIGLETPEQSVLLSNNTPSCTDVQGIAPFGDQEETVFADTELVEMFRSSLV